MKINLTKDEWGKVLYGLELAIYGEMREAVSEINEKTISELDELGKKIRKQLFRYETYAERFVREYGELYTDPEVRVHGEGRGIESMELTPDKRFVIVHWIGGGESKVHVEWDSVAAMVYDIELQAF